MLAIFGDTQQQLILWKHCGSSISFKKTKSEEK